MEETYYPWGGDFTVGIHTNCVAVVLLTIDFSPAENVAIYGSLKTENIGVEKIVANVISNPFIRYLLVCGKDIRGHRSGSSLVALHKHGIDKHHKIIDAPGAIPYIENISEEAITRFQQQTTLVDMRDVTDAKSINTKIAELTKDNPGSFGDPYIAIKIAPKQTVTLDDKRALHSKIIINYTGKIKKRGS